MIKPAIVVMRPWQWLKNVLIFTPIVFDQKLFVADDFIKVLMAFASLSLTASAVYVVNDLIDRGRDRGHHTKRHRPIASGSISPAAALGIVVVILGASGALAARLPLMFTLILGFYLLYNVAYSMWLKHVIFIDVYLIALGFVIRVAAGTVVIEITRFSPWMYLFAGFGSLFIALGKRRAELGRSSTPSTNRPVLADYTCALLDHALVMMASISLVVYALYTFSAPGPSDHRVMMLGIVPLSYVFLRYLYLILVKGLGESPEWMLLTDWPLATAVLLWISLSMVALYVV